MTNDTPAFDGSTYEHKRDHSRLATQLKTVTAVMQRREWTSLSELSMATGYPEASISARLRDLRKEKFGGHEVQRKYVSKGLYHYKLALKQISSP